MMNTCVQPGDSAAPVPHTEQTLRGHAAYRCASMDGKGVCFLPCAFSRPPAPTGPGLIPVASAMGRYGGGEARRSGTPVVWKSGVRSTASGRRYVLARQSTTEQAWICIRPPIHSIHPVWATVLASMLRPTRSQERWPVRSHPIPVLLLCCSCCFRGRLVVCACGCGCHGCCCWRRPPAFAPLPCLALPASSLPAGLASNRRPCLLPPSAPSHPLTSSGFFQPIASLLRAPAGHVRLPPDSSNHSERKRRRFPRSRQRAFLGPFRAASLWLAQHPPRLWLPGPNRIPPSPVETSFARLRASLCAPPATVASRPPGPSNPPGRRGRAASHAARLPFSRLPVARRSALPPSLTPCL